MFVRKKAKREAKFTNQDGVANLFGVVRRAR
jgi:hypothetical protein